MLLLLFQAPGVVAATGIASGEAWGTPDVQGAQNVAPSAIPSAEAWGTAEVRLTVVATSVASAEAWGTPVVLTGANISPTAIPSAEAWGTPRLNRRATASGIASAEAWGTPRLNRRVTASGIASAEAWGTASLRRSAVAASIPSAEAWGTAAVRRAVQPSAVASAEVWGAPSLRASVRASSIPSAEAWGSAEFRLSVRTVSVPSAEAWGAPTIAKFDAIRPASVPSAEAWGNPEIVIVSQTVAPLSIASAEAWGSACVNKTTVGVSGCGTRVFLPGQPGDRSGAGPLSDPCFSLVESLGETVDSLRQLYTDFGLRPYRLFSVVYEWSGGDVGRGTPRVISDEELLPTPKVRETSGVAGEVRSGGLVERGSIRLEQVSPRYTEDQIRVLFHQLPLGPSRQGFLEMRVDRRDGCTERRRFIVRGIPFRHAEGSEWRVTLLRQDEDRLRNGTPPGPR